MAAPAEPIVERVGCTPVDSAISVPSDFDRAHAAARRMWTQTGNTSDAVLTVLSACSDMVYDDSITVAEGLVLAAWREQLRALHAKLLQHAKWMYQAMDVARMLKSPRRINPPRPEEFAFVRTTFQRVVCAAVAVKRECDTLLEPMQSVFAWYRVHYDVETHDRTLQKLDWVVKDGHVGPRLGVRGTACWKTWPRPLPRAPPPLDASVYRALEYKPTPTEWHARLCKAWDKQELRCHLYATKHQMAQTWAEKLHAVQLAGLSVVGPTRATRRRPVRIYDEPRDDDAVVEVFGYTQTDNAAQLALDFAADDDFYQQLLADWPNVNTRG